MNVRLLPAAGEDAANIAVQLDAQRAGWGDDFETEMRRATAAIGANPQMYPRNEDGPDEPENRQYFIARFEYRVIYAIWKGEAAIVAVTHARRRSGNWHTRLTELD